MSISEIIVNSLRRFELAQVKRGIVKHNTFSASQLSIELHRQKKQLVGCADSQIRTTDYTSQTNLTGEIEAIQLAHNNNNNKSHSICPLSL